MSEGETKGDEALKREYAKRMQADGYVLMERWVHRDDMNKASMVLEEISAARRRKMS